MWIPACSGFMAKTSNSLPLRRLMTLSRFPVTSGPTNASAPSDRLAIPIASDAICAVVRFGGETFLRVVGRSSIRRRPSSRTVVDRPRSGGDRVSSVALWAMHTSSTRISDCVATIYMARCEPGATKKAPREGHPTPSLNSTSAAGGGFGGDYDLRPLVQANLIDDPGISRRFLVKGILLRVRELASVDVQNNRRT